MSVNSPHAVGCTDLRVLFLLDYKIKIKKEERSLRNARSEHRAVRSRWPDKHFVIIAPRCESSGAYHLEQGWGRMIAKNEH